MNATMTDAERLAVLAELPETATKADFEAAVARRLEAMIPKNGGGAMSDNTETCNARRPYLGPTDPIRIARTLLIICTKEATHQSPHYDASCDVSWPNDRDDLTQEATDEPR